MSALSTTTKPGPRCLLIADFTVDGLVPYLESEAPAPQIRCITTPFAQVNRLLLDGSAEWWNPRPELALVWTRPDSAIQSFGRLVAGDDVVLDEILNDVEKFAQRLVTASTRVGTMLVPSWTVPATDRGLGVLNLNKQRGFAYHLMRMNAKLVELTSDTTNIIILDAGRWVALSGSRASNPKLWYMGKIAFGPDVLRRAAQDIKVASRAITGRTRKLVVLDLDDTLWGGIVGDVGWEGLRLGGHDPRGEAFCAFQRALMALSRRGVILGIVSKNTESVALEAIQRHPDMVLRLSDFAGWRINWQDKAANVAALATELRLGLDAVVFIDDSPVERARLRQALPDVLTPDWPSDSMLYEHALKELDCFEGIAVSDEDRRRTEMYVTERARRQGATTGDLADYLRSLELRVLVEPLSRVNLERACQLLNKTNQMNLKTRRFTEREYWEWAQDSAHRVFTFRVADRFGEYGLTAVAGVTMKGGIALVDDFVLSCRVMGRGVEEAVLHVLVEHARLERCTSLHAHLVPSSRNEPCRQFFDGQSGFLRRDDQYEWETDNRYPAPGHVQIISETLPTVVGSS